MIRQAQCAACDAFKPCVPGSKAITCAHVTCGRPCLDKRGDAISYTEQHVQEHAMSLCEDVVEWQRRNLLELDL